MSDFSVLLEDVESWIKTGKTPASLSNDVQKLLSEVNVAAAAINGVMPDVPGIVADVEALIASITAVAASKGLDLGSDYLLFVTLRNLVAGLQVAIADGKTAAAVIATQPAATKPAAPPS